MLLRFIKKYFWLIGGLLILGYSLYSLSIGSYRHTVKAGSVSLIWFAAYYFRR